VAPESVVNNGTHALTNHGPASPLRSAEPMVHWRTGVAAKWLVGASWYSVVWLGA
jgi:hypothetical protein